MKSRMAFAFISMFGILTLASPAAIARGGGSGGGMGGHAGAPSGGQHEKSSGQSGEHQGAQAGSERKTAGELLQQNTKLSENLSKLLPAGAGLQSAASGFKNLGEFVAAVHVSHNLGIPFADLKTKMMAGDSLGGAIKVLRPGADSQAEVKKARAQARKDQGR